MPFVPIPVDTAPRSISGQKCPATHKTGSSFSNLLAVYTFKLDLAGEEYHPLASEIIGKKWTAFPVELMQ